MKLVKIKDVRPGQVWINDQTGLVHTVDDLGNLSNTDKADTTKIRDEYLKAAKCRLIGKIGITHRIEDGRLVEIPPLFKDQKINIDDIVKILKDDSYPWVVDTTYNARKCTKYISLYIPLLSYHDCDFSEDEVEKIGILGVTHEFVNNREAEFNEVLE